jgi:hypothetical protein
VTARGTWGVALAIAVGLGAIASRAGAQADEPREGETGTAGDRVTLEGATSEGATPTPGVGASTTATTETVTTPSATAAASESESDTVRASTTPRPLLTGRRAVIDYDGREDEGPDAGEILLWVPRILFGPITLVLDYGIRRPLGWFVSTAEQENWDGLILDVVTWNERRSGLVPTFMLAYGLQPAVGLLFFSNDDIAPGHSMGASVTFGGLDFLQGSGSYSITMLDRRVRLELRGEGGRRPDRVFSGIGWDALSAQYRFREAWYEGEARLSIDYWRQSRLSIAVGVDGHEFDPNGYAALSTNSPPLAEGLAQGAFARPAALDQGYVAYRQRAALSLDTRELEPAPGHGLRIEAQGELAFDLVDPVRYRWVRWGGGVGAFADLGNRRVLGLWGIARFSDPLGQGDVPFTELIALGEEALLMQGFLRGQLRGRSAAAATLEYIYPIWTRLDGRLHVSAGNAFGPHLTDFLFERLRLSFGIGIATAGEPDDAFELTIAAGTAPFVEGATIDSLQVVFGSRQGF